MSITVDTPPAAGNDSTTTYKNVPVTVNVLGNDSDPDGTLNAATVSIVAAAAHGTTSVNPTTGAITYTPAANFTGTDSFTYKVKDNLGIDSNVATVSIVVNPTGSISGKEFLDVTGNGLTSDDTPLAGVKVYLDTNNDGAWNSTEPSFVTAPTAVIASRTSWPVPTKCAKSRRVVISARRRQPATTTASRWASAKLPRA